MRSDIYTNTHCIGGYVVTPTNQPNLSWALCMHNGVEPASHRVDAVLWTRGTASHSTLLIGDRIRLCRAVNNNSKT